MHVEQMRLQKESWKKLEDQARELEEMGVFYQKSLKEYSRAEFNAKAADDAISRTCEAIRKAHIVLEKNEQILQRERKKIADLNTHNSQLQQDLAARSSLLEVAKAKFNEEQSLSNEELRAKAIVVAKAT